MGVAPVVAAVAVEAALAGTDEKKNTNTRSTTGAGGREHLCQVT